MKEPMPLDREDIKVMRQAETVSFHLRKGESYLLLTMKRDRHGNAPQITIPVLSNLRVYGLDSCHDHEYGEDRSTCFAMLHSTGDYGPWRAVCALCKPGSVLTLEWVGNNHSPAFNARNTGLHVDHLNMRIRNDRAVYNLLIDYEIHQDDSIRMIRR